MHLHWCCVSVGRCFCIALLLVLTPPLAAHEFWIEPVSYQIDSGEKIVAHLRNGEKFEGSGQPYVKNNTNRFDMFTSGTAQPIQARMGDIPAVNVTVDKAGLAIVVHEKKITTLRYSKWEKFQRFADHKAFANIKQRHEARGLPESGFKEAYSRYSKSLVAVASGDGSDEQVDLAVELVALNNPYTDDLANGLTVAGFHLGEPVPHIQIELFEKNQSGVVTVSLHKTDGNGEVTLPVKPAHSYLVDMVILREPSAELAMQHNVAWETLWASLTFAVP